MRFDTKSMPAIMLAALVATMATVTALPIQAYADDGNGLIVPLYGWDSGWDDVIDAKDENSGTEIIAVINPSNGPGGSSESHWEDVVDDLQDEGIKVVGYISTNYAGRSMSSVEDETDRYYDWYDVDGIFLDEVSPNDLDYYKDIREMAEDPKGSQIVILNPGASVPKSYSSAADIIVVYENSGIPSDITSNGISESKLAALPYGLEPSENEFKDLSDEVGYLYVPPSWLHAASNIDDQADWAD